MKINEVPEKIYLTYETDDENYSDYIFMDYMWHRHPFYEKTMQNIEYTRTNTLIDKVCELLARMIWEVTYEDLEGNSVSHHDKMKFIEEFKKAMEKQL